MLKYPKIITCLKDRNKNIKLKCIYPEKLSTKR